MGSSVATTMTSQLVVDAVAQAIWTRQLEGKDLAGLVADHDHGSQYLSVAHIEHLDAAGIKPSTGGAGSSYDKALAESTIGFYKTELIKFEEPPKRARLRMQGDRRAGLRSDRHPASQTRSAPRTRERPRRVKPARDLP